MTASRDEATGLEAGLFGMRLFIASLAMLFAATMIGYSVVRFRAVAWPPPGSPPFPVGLYISTALLALSGVTMQGSVVTIGRGKKSAFLGSLFLTTVLGYAFLAAQYLNWRELGSRGLLPEGNLFGFTFYFLTVLHALHVLGGCLPLTTVSIRAYRGRYTAASHAGVRYIALYWHFLLVVWIVILLFLVL